MAVAAGPQNEAAAAEICALIIDSAGDVDLRDAKGRTPLHLVASYQLAQVCNTLLCLRADVSAVAGGAGSATPLHVAARAASVEVCTLLVEARANLEMCDQ